MCQLQFDFAHALANILPPSADITAAGPDLEAYDRYVIFFSGGKDSISCVLHLLECGVDPERIELHHHDVDGREGSNLFDWPITRSYCRSFAHAFGLRIFFSWKKGGLEGEMLRDNQLTAPIKWEREDGTVAETGGTGGKPSTRRMFPQVTADLSRRWCSAYGKIDVGARLLTTEGRFREGKTLVITGERAEESANRARYKVFEPHRTDNRDGARVQRWIDQWRPVHTWSEQQVWDIMRRHRVNAHPCYWLGWGRCSCMTCIFGSPHQWASVQKASPDRFQRVANYETEFNVTIHRKLSVIEQAAKGTAYEMDPAMIALANSEHYPEDLILVPENQWEFPPGAFGESVGPS